jgi:hypothetical protein
MCARIYQLHIHVSMYTQQAGHMGQSLCAFRCCFNCFFKTRFAVQWRYMRWESHALMALYNTVCFLKFVRSVVLPLNKAVNPLFLVIVNKSL